MLIASLTKSTFLIINSYKYSGINLNDKLNFDERIENIESKILPTSIHILT